MQHTLDELHTCIHTTVALLHHPRRRYLPHLALVGDNNLFLSVKKGFEFEERKYWNGAQRQSTGTRKVARLLRVALARQQRQVGAILSLSSPAPTPTPQVSIRTGGSQACVGIPAAGRWTGCCAVAVAARFFLSAYLYTPGYILAEQQQQKTRQVKRERKTRAG